MPPNLTKKRWARVVKIGNLGIKEAKERLTATVLSEVESKNEWYVLNFSAIWMISPAVLQTVGIVSSVERVPFTFETDAGKQFTLEIASVKRTIDAASGTVKLPVPLLSAAKEDPLYLQKPTEDIWSVYLPDSQTVYVKFRRYPKCGLLGVGGCQEFDDVMKLVDEKKPTRLVFDLRANSGGDSTKVRRSLIPAIQKRAQINQKGHLFVITGRRTFSAALWNAVDFKNRRTRLSSANRPASSRTAIRKLTI